MRTKFIAIAAAAALVGFAATANASIMSVSADKATYNVGETIVLTITTDSEGELIANAFAQVLYDSGLASNSAPESQDLGSPGQWQASPLDQFESPGVNTALNQTDFNALFGNLSDPGTSIGSTIRLVADAVGVLNLTLGSATTTAFQFGAGNTAPNTVNNTSVTIVPEPTTAALLGLGLFGLALGGRRR